MSIIENKIEYATMYFVQLTARTPGAYRVQSINRFTRSRQGY